MNQNQHYLSQVYLKYWSHDNKNIYRYDKNTKQTESLPIKNVGAINNQWAPTIENPIFSNFEAQYTDIIKALESREKITDQINNYLIDMMSMLYARVPKQKRNMKKFSDEFLKTTPTMRDLDQGMIAQTIIHNQAMKNMGSKSVILIAKNNKTFITTDNPASANFLCLPLTPKLLVITPNGNIPMRYLDADESSVSFFNKKNTEMADKYIFSLEQQHEDI